MSARLEIDEALIQEARGPDAPSPRRGGSAPPLHRIDPGLVQEALSRDEIRRGLRSSIGHGQEG